MQVLGARPTFCSVSSTGPNRVFRMRVLPPINVIYLYMERKTPVTVWLTEQNNTRLEGTISGFDEFMNLVLENAVEVNQKTSSRRDLGQLLLKGENVQLICA